MNVLFQEDIYRYYGDNRIPAFYRIFPSPEIKYLKLLRASQKSRGLLRKLYRTRLLSLQRKTHIQIPAETKIGGGFYIGHLGRIIISPNAVLGRNVNIATGVTIGKTNRGTHKGVPVIGDCVWIGTNAVIVGGINIGDDVLIAPNAYVNKDIPSHSIVLGNPCTVISRVNATMDYIDNKV